MGASSAKKRSPHPRFPLPRSPPRALPPMSILSDVEEPQKTDALVLHHVPDGERQLSQHELPENDAIALFDARTGLGEPRQERSRLGEAGP